MTRRISTLPSAWMCSTVRPSGRSITLGGHAHAVPGPDSEPVGVGDRRPIGAVEPAGLVAVDHTWPFGEDNRAAERPPPAARSGGGRSRGVDDRSRPGALLWRRRRLMGIPAAPAGGLRDVVDARWRCVGDQHATRDALTGSGPHAGLRVGHRVVRAPIATRMSSPRHRYDSHGRIAAGLPPSGAGREPAVAAVGRSLAVAVVALAVTRIGPGACSGCGSGAWRSRCASARRPASGGRAGGPGPGRPRRPGRAASARGRGLPAQRARSRPSRARPRSLVAQGASSSAQPTRTAADRPRRRSATIGVAAARGRASRRAGVPAW